MLGPGYVSKLPTILNYLITCSTSVHGPLLTFSDDLWVWQMVNNNWGENNWGRYFIEFLL